MRIALVVITLLFAMHPARGATAYEALRVLGKQKGEALLDSVIEVRGDKGKPQPAVWKVTVKDATARGGAKEYSVQGSRLTGEQMPIAKTAGSPMNMSQLNLDSDGVHQIAEREAKKVNFAYDHATYQLLAGSRGGSPVWEIRLVDEQTGEAGTLTLAATTGAVLSSDGLTRRSSVAKAAPTPVPARPQPQPARQSEKPERIAEAPNQSFSPGVQRVGDDLSRFVGRVGRHMSRRGRQIGDTFYNIFHEDKRHTAGPHGSEPERTTPPPPRQDSDADFVKPSRVRD